MLSHELQVAAGGFAGSNRWKYLPPCSNIPGTAPPGSREACGPVGFGGDAVGHHPGIRRIDGGSAVRVQPDAIRRSRRRGRPSVGTRPAAATSIPGNPDSSRPRANRRRSGPRAWCRSPIPVSSLPERSFGCMAGSSQSSVNDGLAATSMPCSVRGGSPPRRNSHVRRASAWHRGVKSTANSAQPAACCPVGNPTARAPTRRRRGTDVIRRGHGMCDHSAKQPEIRWPGNVTSRNRQECGHAGRPDRSVGQVGEERRVILDSAVRIRQRYRPSHARFSTPADTSKGSDAARADRNRRMCIAGT